MQEYLKIMCFFLYYHYYLVQDVLKGCQFEDCEPPICTLWTEHLKIKKGFFPLLHCVFWFEMWDASLWLYFLFFPFEKMLSWQPQNQVEHLTVFSYLLHFFTAALYWLIRVNAGRNGGQLLLFLPLSHLGVHTVDESFNCCHLQQNSPIKGCFYTV